MNRGDHFYAQPAGGRPRLGPYEHRSRARAPAAGADLLHEWIPEGRFEDGDPRSRCVRCKAHNRMAMARDVCVRAPRVSTGNTAIPGERLVWPGKASGDRPKACAHCGEMFVRRRHQGRVSYCGPTCTDEAQAGRRVVSAALEKEQRAEVAAEKQAARIALLEPEIERPNRSKGPWSEERRLAHGERVRAWHATTGKALRAAQRAANGGHFDGPALFGVDHAATLASGSTPGGKPKTSEGSGAPAGAQGRRQGGAAR